MSELPRLDDHVLGLVRWAWCRELGLPEGSLDDPSDRSRLEVAGPADAVVVLQLAGATALRAPADVLGAARDLPDEVLALESTLLRLTARHAPRSLGEADLLYAAEAPEISPSSSVAVSDAPEHAARLTALCPADDVHAADLGPAPLTLVPDDGHGEALGDPLAGAGHTVWQGLLARMGILTVPEHRVRGLGTYAAAVAAERAFLDGLVPEARVRTQDRAGQAIAMALGFARAGSLTRIELTAGR